MEQQQQKKINKRTKGKDFWLRARLKTSSIQEEKKTTSTNKTKKRRRRRRDLQTCFYFYTKSFKRGFSIFSCNYFTTPTKQEKKQNERNNQPK